MRLTTITHAARGWSPRAVSATAVAVLAFGMTAPFGSRAAATTPPFVHSITAQLGAAQPVLHPPAATASANGVVAEAPLPNGQGFWSVTADGTVTSYAAAPYEGGLSGTRLAAPILSISSTPDGGGYWLVAADGGIFSFGDAQFLGSTGNLHLNRSIVAMAATPDGRGYWLVASDGGIFSFGDAGFYGSTGNVLLAKPMVGMAATPDGRGYWLVASDGGIFSFGDAGFYGSTGNVLLAKPMVGMAATPDGRGYGLVASDGGIFSFGDASFYGSAAGRLDGGSAVGMITTSGGYWIATTTGGVLSFGAAPILTLLAAQAPSRSALLSDPPANILPSTAFEQACYVVNSATCTSVALAAIDSAHAAEGIPALSLPANYSSLSHADQMVVVTNAERQERHLSAFAGPRGSLDSLALLGAQANTDPTGPAGTSWASIWASGYATVLAADFAWMYDDGIGSDNIDCTPSNPSGCWGHRHNILVPWAGSMGAAFTTQGSGNSMAELFVSS
jgi:hypothetical protein